jgi:hypothetical protein
MTAKSLSKILRSVRSNEPIPSGNVLDLSGECVTGAELSSLTKTLCKSISVNYTLVQLNLSRIQFRDEDLEVLVGGLSKNTSLRSLDLSYNLLSDKGVTHIIYMLRDNVHCGLKQIYLHGNPSLSLNTELLIWHVLGARHLPTAINMVDNDAQRRQQQISQLKRIRQKLSVLYNDLNVSDKRSARYSEIEYNTRSGLESVIDEFLKQESPGTRLELLECIGESRYQCLFDGFCGDFEWIWKDSLRWNWKECVSDLNVLQSLPTHPCVQLVSFCYDGPTLVFAVFGASSQTLHSCISKKSRSRIQTNQPLWYDTTWISFCYQITTMIVSALEFLHYHHYPVSLLNVNQSFS